MSKAPVLTPGHRPPLKGPYLRTRVEETGAVGIGNGRVSYKGPRSQDFVMTGKPGRYGSSRRLAPLMPRVKQLAKSALNPNLVEVLLNKPVN